MDDLRALLEMRQASPLSSSADGSMLLVDSDVPGTRQLYSVPVRGGELRQLTRFTEPVGGQFLDDGRILLEIDAGGDGAATQLYTVAAELGAVLELLVVDERYIHSSPHIGRDGTLLAYRTNRRNDWKTKPTRSRRISVRSLSDRPVRSRSPRNT